MTNLAAMASAPTARRGTGSVAVTGAGVLSAYGRGTEALLSGALSGRPAFAPVQRFDVGARRVRFAATMPGSPELRSEVTRAAGEACDDAGPSPPHRAPPPPFLPLPPHPPLPPAPP